jgi:hypothetical protein
MSDEMSEGADQTIDPIEIDTETGSDSISDPSE